MKSSLLGINEKRSIFDVIQKREYGWLWTCYAMHDGLLRYFRDIFLGCRMKDSKQEYLGLYKDYIMMSSIVAKTYETVKSEAEGSIKWANKQNKKSVGLTCWQQQIVTSSCDALAMACKMRSSWFWFETHSLYYWWVLNPDQPTERKTSTGDGMLLNLGIFRLSLCHGRPFQ